MMLHSFPKWSKLILTVRSRPLGHCQLIWSLHPWLLFILDLFTLYSYLPIVSPSLYPNRSSSSHEVRWIFVGNYCLSYSLHAWPYVLLTAYISSFLATRSKSQWRSSYRSQACKANGYTNFNSLLEALCINSCTPNLFTHYCACRLSIAALILSLFLCTLLNIQAKYFRSMLANDDTSRWRVWALFERLALSAVLRWQSRHLSEALCECQVSHLCQQLCNYLTNSNLCL